MARGGAPGQRWRSWMQVDELKCGLKEERAGGWTVVVDLSEIFSAVELVSGVEIWGYGGKDLILFFIMSFVIS